MLHWFIRIAELTEFNESFAPFRKNSNDNPSIESRWSALGHDQIIDEMWLVLSRNSNQKDVNIKHPVFLLGSTDSSIRVTVLPLNYADMYFMHQSTVIIYRPITTNI